MLTALLAAAAMAPAASAEDYFPLTAGSKWTYQNVSTGEVVVQETGPAIDIGGQQATPLWMRERGRRGETAYYRVDGDTVYIVAYDPKKPLKDPIPTLKVGTGKVKWAYSGSIPFEGGDAILSQSSEAVAKKAKVLDVPTDVIEVKTDALVGGIKFKTTVLFAKGLGMVENSGETRFGKQLTRQVLRLTKFEPGKPGSD